MSVLKRMTALLPERRRQDLKRFQFARQIRAGRFGSPEPEFACAADLVKPGDWVLDIGANVGHYTARFSALAGPTGRVFAFEPIPETFELLATNAALFPYENVTLLNMAASDASRLVAMEIPEWEGRSGVKNYYRAAITEGSGAGKQIFCCALDALDFPHSIQLVKLDAEGHELPALQGMKRLLARDKPIVIMEANAPEPAGFLRGLGYNCERLPGSPNEIFRFEER